MKRESIFAFIRRFGLSEGRVYGDIYELSQYHRKTWAPLSLPAYSGGHLTKVVHTAHLLGELITTASVTKTRSPIPTRGIAGEQSA